MYSPQLRQSKAACVVTPPTHRVDPPGFVCPQKKHRAAGPLICCKIGSGGGSFHRDFICAVELIPIDFQSVPAILGERFCRALGE